INGLTDQIVANDISVATGYANPNLVNINLPQGIAVDASRGKIYVADFGLGAPDQLVVLKTGVQPTITITSTPAIPGLNLGGSYSYQVVANNNDGLPITYSLKGEPVGMQISANGLISWTPTVSGAFKYTVIAADPNGVSAKQTVNVTVCAAGKNWVSNKGGMCISPTALKTGG
ncbi:MAG: Ig domain-containing protein, partial [Methylomonas sp.]